MDNNSVMRIILILLAVAILFALIAYYNSSKGAAHAESFEADMKAVEAAKEQFMNSCAPANPLASNESSQCLTCPGEAAANSAAIAGVEPLGNEKYRPVSFTGVAKPGDCFPKDRLNAKDLLPGNANSTWAQANPAGQGDVANQNFLTAAYQIGINTVGQSLRNANLQLRSEPLNPQLKVSPWNQTTIEPDINRKPLEIGA